MSAARPDLGEDCIQSFNRSPRIPSTVSPQENICLQSRNRQTQHKYVNKWHTSQSEFLVSNALMIWLNNTYPFWGKRIHFPIPTQNETSNLCQKSNGAILKNPVGTYSRSLKPNPNFRSWYQTLIFAAEKVEIHQASNRVKPVEWCKLWS